MHRNARLLLPALLVALGFAVYLGSLSGSFQYDDYPMIVSDRSIRTPWPIGGHHNRPVLTLTLKLDYLLWGLEPAGFRFTNIVIHIAGALLLFGIVRRTLLRPTFGAVGETTARGIAFSVAALWLVHPLNTQAVTYVWQRCESLMGMLFLAAIYALVRAAEGERRRLWSAMALATCFLGLGTKEVMIAVIPVLLLYDGILLSPSFKGALRARRAVYATLGVVALLALVVVLPQTKTNYGEVTSLAYAASQPGVILDYLRLSLWPHPLCFDYSLEPASGFFAIAIPALVVAALVAVTVRQLVRRSWIGVAGAWFFLVLAPTSSIAVINDLMVEYRMYLPLIPVVALVVAGARALCRQVRVPPAVPLVAALLALSTLTVLRNRDYENWVTLWESVLEILPDNARAHGYLAGAYLGEGRAGDALLHARRAAELAPEQRLTHVNLASVLRQTGDFAGALEQLEIARRIKGWDASLHREIGEVLVQLERYEEAVERLRHSLRIDARPAATHIALARAFYAQRKFGKAALACRRALERRPENAAYWRYLGQISMKRGDHGSAIDALEQARALQPDDPTTLKEIGGAYAAAGRYDVALRYLEQAMRADPRIAPRMSETARGVVSRQAAPGERAMAVRLAELAVDATGRRDHEVLADLVRVYVAAGRTGDARAAYAELVAIPGVARNQAVRRAYAREFAALGR